MTLTLDPSLRDLNDCECCLGVTATTSAAIDNRPGLSAIAYRIGTHSKFKGTMLSRLSSVRLPALRRLQTRSDEDLAIALLDAWATVADVITFYQERIANESYLRTATERRSLRYLARLIGYELRPGVAASAFLAFTVEAAPGGPAEVQVENGVRVLSIPGPGQLPQTFETVESILARPEWNAMRPRLFQPQLIATTMKSVTLKGVAANLKPGDSILIRAGNTTGEMVVKRVIRAVADPAANTTRVDLDQIPEGPPPFKPNVLAVAPFFIQPLKLTTTSVASNVLQYKWKQADLFAQAVVQKWPVFTLMFHINFLNIAHPIEAEKGVFAFRQKAAIFGHNAPKYTSLPINQRTGDEIYDKNGNKIPTEKVYSDWDTPARTLANETSGNDIFLDNVYSGVIPKSFVALEGSTDPNVKEPKIYQVESNTEVSRSDFTLNAKVSRLVLNSNNGFDKLTLRNTTVLAQSERLELADLPVEEPVETVELSLDRLYLGLTIGQKVILTGERADLAGVVESEVLTLADVTFSGGYTNLVFAKAPKNSYVRKTVTINANVALATHGEKKEEALGSGDSSQPFQRFSLRQPPLTYVSAPTPSGAETTLQVRVNELLWREVPSLYGHSPDEHVYITRTDEEGNTTVQFGDGQTGARLPTGQENIRALYRKGIGEEGLVGAGQLSLLATRPLGVRSVTNPRPASGAASRETLAEARSNAPLTVLTLDRIVSLQDYEDFARAFSGIAKALATWAWDGRQRIVFVTIAGPDGAEIDQETPSFTNLLAAMQKAGDPLILLRVKTYRQAFFRLECKIKVHPDYLTANVLADAESALRSSFSFEARSFGQPVHLSEVMAVLQRVPGLVAVDVDYLYRTDAPEPELQTLLVAEGPKISQAELFGAELLILDPRPLNPGVMA